MAVRRPQTPEDIMTETPTARRDAYESIDFDFYRTRAAALRGQAMRDAATLRTASVGALVMAGALGFAIAIPPAGTAHDRLAAAWSASTQMR
jgi:hypothetical protein